MSAKKLEKKDIEAALRRLRSLDKSVIEIITPLIHHMYWQRDEIERLLAEKQGKLFQKVESRFVTPSSGPAVTTNEYLYGLVKENKEAELIRYMRLRSLTAEALLKQVNEWATATGRPNV